MYIRNSCFLSLAHSCVYTQLESFADDVPTAKPNDENDTLREEIKQLQVDYPVIVSLNVQHSNKKYRLLLIYKRYCTTRSVSIADEYSL